MDRSAVFGLGGRIARVDIVRARPSGTGMRMHLVEVADAIDVGPGVQGPAHRTPWVTVLGQHAAGCLVGHFIHPANNPSTGIAAEFGLTRLRVPSPGLL